MKSEFYFDRLKLSSQLKRTPKANKKINFNNFFKGYDNMLLQDVPIKRYDKCSKLENNDLDYIAGTETAGLHLLNLKG